MRKLSFWISLAAAVCCVLYITLGILQSQEDGNTAPQITSSKVIKTLSLTNADSKSVLTYLSSYSGLNIVASPKGEGNITLRLSNISWKEALDIILDTYNFVGVESDNYIRVVQAEDYYAEKAAEEKHIKKYRPIPHGGKVFISPDLHAVPDPAVLMKKI